MSYKYFRCEWIREEPNDNLETYLKVKDELLLEEYIKKNKGKTIEEIETEEILSILKEGI